MAAAAAVKTSVKQTYAFANWNILASEYTRYNTPSGKDETQEQRNKRWTDIVMFLSGGLANAPLDIVTLQEVTVDFIKYAFDGISSVDMPEMTKKMAGALKPLYHLAFCKREYPKDIDVGKTQGSKVDGCAILTNKAKFAPFPNKEQSDVKSEFISPTIEGQFSKDASKSPKDPRCFLAANLCSAFTGDPLLTVICVHLEGDPKSNVRPLQIAEATKAAKAVFPDSPFTVMAGDFNEGPTPSILAALNYAGLKPLTINYGNSILDEDTFSSIFGNIDLICVSSSLGVSSPSFIGEKGLVMLPPPSQRKQTTDAQMVKGRSGAKPSIYLNPPYDDGGMWPSDHYAGMVYFCLPTKNK